MGERLHLEAEIGPTGKESGRSHLRWRKIFRDKENDGKGLLHYPLAVDHDPAAEKGKEAGEKDDFVANA